MKRALGYIADFLRETDKILIILCIIASLFGSALVYSATYRTGSARQFYVQLAAVAIGLGVAVAISLAEYKKLSKNILVFIGVSLALLIYTYFFGLTPVGSENKAWIQLPLGMTFQPSEFVKITMILCFAKHVSLLGDNINRPLNVFLLCADGLCAPALIIVLQKDVGTAIVMIIMFIGMLFCAGVKLRYFALGGVCLAALAPVLWFYGFSEYMRQRFLILLDLESDPLGMGYQQLQGIEAIGSGGISGYGYLNGPKVQSGAVPKAYNDFIFATAGEELGFIGCCAVILILLLLVGRILYVSTVSRDKMGSIICVGVFSMFVAQIMINLGMVLALFPVVGVTLPFFSAGGTSLVCLFGGVGLVLSVYSHRNDREIDLHSFAQR
jgi:rod shape determining protein RodA